MCQHTICNRGQPFPGVLVLVSDRFVAQIAAGHHQYRRATWLNSSSESVQQQVVQRRVGQHHSQRIVGWRDAWCH